MKKLKETERTERERYLYHNTELLLKRYRDVVWSVEASLEQAKLGFESEMECKLEEFLEMSYVAGFDLSNTNIEEHMRTLERNRKMLSYIDSAAKLLKKKQPDGEILYLIIYYTYLSEKKFESTDEILTKIIEHKIFLTEKSYYRKRKTAIQIMSTLLWGFTSKDCLEFLEKMKGI
ncbi:MAG: hypothetical protein IJQ28_05805 [Clostridia bacterium]|nr:hypothetical protein [Clostridia bacterium]